MKRALSVIAVACAMAAAVGVATTNAGAQAAQAASAMGATKVAVVIPQRVLSEMQEAKDLTEKMKNESGVMRQKLTDMQKSLQDLRDQQKLLKPESQQFMDKSREVTTAAIQFEATQKTMQVEMERVNRTQLKSLFDKIVAATEKVAKQKGFDIVLADTHVPIPDNLEGTSVEALQNVIRQRTILYARPEVDLTTDVIASLDAEYKK